MSSHNLVVTVRLSDVDEKDQPDPICLPAQELATWRHFEALLLNMYRQPPPAIKVCYLDDESDWIEMSSDTELREAIKVAQDTDELLQLQVKRRDTSEVTYESTLSAPSIGSGGPHVTPIQTTYFRERSQQPLVYPHPPYMDSGHSIPPSPDPGTGQPWLVYPHPTPNCCTDPGKVRDVANVLLLEADGTSAYIQNRPDLSTEDKVQCLKARLATPKQGSEENLKGLNTCLSFNEMWKKASSLSSEDKLKFMKSMCASGVEDEKREEAPVAETPDQPKAVKSEEASAFLMEPLSNVGDTPALPSQVQDPFEFVCAAQPSTDLEQVQLNLKPGSILEPEKPNSTTKKSKLPRSAEDDKATPKSVTVNMEKAEEQGLVCAKTGVSRGQEMNVRPFIPPVAPQPAVQFMEGAQSGANAVAIEIPEGYQHGAAKEEDATASGGAACTLASAETGEAVEGTRARHEGAAVCHKQMKATPCGSRAEASTVIGQKISSKKGRKSGLVKTTEEASAAKSKKEVTVCKGASTSGTKRKSSSTPDKKKSSRDKEMSGVLRDKEASRTEADVESGEKVVREKDSALQYRDFTHYMKKVKHDLHSNIVKDVTKATGKLIAHQMLRSASYSSSACSEKGVVHKGIYCDKCNAVIRGIRFKCGNCADFDLCDMCESHPNGHDPSHVFLKLRRPAVAAGRVGKEKFPLLREIVYKDKDVSSPQEKTGKTQSLGDVPILSVSEVPTPKPKRSPPAPDTLTQGDKQADVASWVWDSTFDTDHKNLYPLEGEVPKPGKQFAPSDLDMERLYGLLSQEAEAQRRDEMVVPETVDELNLDDKYRGKEQDRGENPTSLEEDKSLLSAEFVEAGDVEEEGGQVVEAEDVEEESGEVVEEREEDFEELLDCDGERPLEGEEENCQEAKTDQIVQGQRTGQSDASDSDTSDDFCILDPPSRDDSGSDYILSTPFVGLIDHQEDEQIVEAASEASGTAPTTTGGDGEVAEEDRDGTRAVSDQMEAHCVTASELTTDAVCGEMSACQALPAAEEPIIKHEVCVKEAEVDGLVAMKNDEEKDSEKRMSGMEEKAVERLEMNKSDDYEDILKNMSMEERRLFLDMFKNLKERAEDLERERKACKEEDVKEKLAEQQELAFQRILEEKQKEAARENDKLEELRKTEQEERERKTRQKRKEVRQIVPGAVKRSGASARGSAESGPTLMQMALNAPNKTPDNVILSDPGQVKATTYQEGENQIAERKDADCQTMSMSSGGGSQMFHNVASGMSKVAEAAFHTAKDVFYSLQAKQMEKKTCTGVVYSKSPSGNSSGGKMQETVSTTQSSNWTPPADVYIPPKSTWTPPKSEWTPPKSEWTPPKSEWNPPKSEWNPPKSEWNPPKGYYIQPGPDGQPAVDSSAPTNAGETEVTVPSGSGEDSDTIVDQVTSCTRPLPSPLSPSQIADPVLRREVQGLQTLMEMGFANREQNRKLLQQYDGNVEKVVQVLLQEERGEHWAWQRH